MHYPDLNIKAVILSLFIAQLTLQMGSGGLQDFGQFTGGLCTLLLQWEMIRAQINDSLMSKIF